MSEFSVSKRIYAGVFAVVAAMAVTAGLSIHLDHRVDSMLKTSRSNAVAAAALADAQSALWELRYGFPQFMVLDEAGRQKIRTAEPLLRQRIEDAFKRYEGTDMVPSEQKSLVALKETFGSYMGARPKWFDLYGSGKVDEAKDWRAATTTPLGAATVKGFAEVLQAQAEAGNAKLAEVEQTLATGRVLVFIALTLTCMTLLGSAPLLLRMIRRPLIAASALAKRISSGDLTHQPVTNASDEFGALMGNLGEMVDNLRNSFSQVRDAAQAILVTSAEVASGNTDLSGRTEQTASSLQQTSSAMEQLTQSVRQSADSSHQASLLAGSASEAAQRGGTVVSQVVATMDDINTASRRISDIIGTIDGIAFQTNILALNAAVEAARAGEQGRGFAVVASEVRNLAQRSADAAREIKGLISASVEKVDNGARLVQDAGATMTEIVNSVQRVAVIIGQISGATREQSQGIGQINASVGQLDQMTQQNSALVEQSTAAAESLKGQAQRLGKVVAQFRVSA